MELSLGTLFYLSMRLLPFILVSFFVIISIFNWDLSGLVYLVGLIITMGIYNIISIQWTALKQPVMCDDPTGFSIPANQLVLGYTISYLFTTLIARILTGELITTYLPIIIFFILLLISDMIINSKLLYIDSCYPILDLLQIYGFSMGCGVIWSYLITAIGNNNMMFFSNNSTNDSKKCTVNSNTKYKCTRYVNGIINNS
jgi:hypothetical protein